MMPSISIEPMVESDLPEVVEIERLGFDSPWSTGLFLHELKLPFSRVRVARSVNGSGKIVGYACWWVVAEEAHILNVAVHPERRRRGVATALIQLILDDAAAKRARSVSLEVKKGNEAALALYRSMGFSQIGLRMNYYGRGEHAIIMALRLDGIATQRLP
jgi:ribosomal-protein-alanine N-acetyltransferase